MKYRVMIEGDPPVDFDDPTDAILFASKKKRLTISARIEGKRPQVTIHDCYHDERKPCTNLREV